MKTQAEILEYLEELGRPILDMHLVEALALEPEDMGAFHNVMVDLEASGAVIKTKKGKYALPIHMNIVLGRLQTHQKGFGFVLPQNIQSEDIFIPASELSGGMNGDLVFCKVTGISDMGRRKEGVIIKILKRANEKVVGTFESNDSYGFVVPDDKKIAMDIYISREHFNGAKSGQKVVVKITRWPEGRRNPEGLIAEVIGFMGEKGVDVLSVIKKFQLPEDFPKKVLKEAEGISQEVTPEMISGRRDLRDQLIVTIDGADAKDLDDAVGVMHLDNGNYRLGVHIADVTHYVREGSKLDREALERGTSVYLIDRVIPMLPHALSNGICSLNPSVNRLTLSCEMEITPTGEVVHHEIFESVIKTTHRMIYTDVSDMLEHLGGAFTRPELEQYRPLLPLLKDMETLSLILRSRREARGAIDFDFPEPQITLDEGGKPLEIINRERRIANRIIEEFMLVANETVAEHVFWLEYPFVYRIHENPDPERIANFNIFLNRFGLRLKGGEDEMHPKAVQQLLESVEGKREAPIVNKMMLRALKQAKYSPSCDGHFGLAAKYYCHFTSPIRRYPDLQIHRILKEMLHQELTPSRVNALKSIVDYASRQSSERERIAEQAERETDDMKKCEYMLRFVGQEFEGVVSSVTSFGMFIALENTIEGLARVSMMDDDYYHYDETHMTLIGERKRVQYTIGDSVQVRVENVNVGYREIDFKVLKKLS